MAVKWEGHQRVEQQLRALAEGVEDRQPLTEGIGLYLEGSTIARFDSETAPDGSRWAPSIRARVEGGKTLTDNAHLRGSIGYIADNDRVEWGSNLVYARPHQLGWEGKEEVSAHSRTISSAFGMRLKSPVTFEVSPFSRQANLPKREFLGINAEDERQIIGIAEDYVASLAPEAGA